VGNARTRVLSQVGYRVGVERYYRGLNWNELAKLAGQELRSPQIGELESGNRDVHLTTLIRIAKALDFRSIDSLLGPMPIELLD
jgi:transcriptional regulator with XRE-family HTH domain